MPAWLIVANGSVVGSHDDPFQDNTWLVVGVADDTALPCKPDTLGKDEDVPLPDKSPDNLIMPFTEVVASGITGGIINKDNAAIAS